MKNKKCIYSLLIITTATFIVGTLASISFKSDSLNLDVVSSALQKPIVFDRHYRKLHLSYLDQWNPNVLPLSSFSPFLVEALIKSEDRRFYQHYGIDIFAKARAVYQNLMSLSFQQGGSTISEQVVRILLGSPENLWQRWIQSGLALVLENRKTKEQILEFYVNQVPFASNRRGFAQAADLYFNRDLETLSKTEMMTLVVLLRAPSRFDIRKGNTIKKRISMLANELQVNDISMHMIESGEGQYIEKSYRAFVDYAIAQAESENGKLVTTLDMRMQDKLSNLVRKRISALKAKNVSDGAAMIVDHTTGEILAMVSINAEDNHYGYNSALVPRQPGSTLKPFLYGQHIMLGARPYHLINDTPISTAISHGGLHEVNNYSRGYYGSLSIREALANSLNVPAIKIVRQLGVDKFFNLLLDTGLTLPRGASYYGEGIALGNAEVSLYEMMRAYTCLANRGQCLSLRVTKNQLSAKRPRVFNQTTSDMILDILSDPVARQKEFGSYHFGHQVAVKTGTSTDFKDSWAFVMNRKYLVGVWIGNLNNEPMLDVTGSVAALPVAKSIIDDSLLRNGVGQFPLSPLLSRKQWCFPNDEGCEERSDLFIVGEDVENFALPTKEASFSLEPDSERVFLAIDPRIPIESQIFKVSTNAGSPEVAWYIDDQPQGVQDILAIKLQKGKFTITAKNLTSNTSRTMTLYVR